MGGCITNSGDLNLSRVDVTFCRAASGGGIANFSGASLTMVASEVKSNTVSSHGGGVATSGTMVMNEGSFVTGNTAELGGGGLLVDGGSLTLNGGSFVRKNTVTDEDGRGGGIRVFNDAPLVFNGGSVQGNDPDDCDPDQGSCQ